MSAPISRPDAGVAVFLRSDALQFCLPRRAPVFLCPSCQCALHYEGSRSTGGSDREIDLADSYVCPAGRGSYEYVRRTHRLRLAQLRMHMSEQTLWESFKAESDNFVEKLRTLIHEGNVRRVIVKHDGRTIAEFPLTAGVESSPVQTQRDQAAS